jgi:hypothetical protein
VIFSDEWLDFLGTMWRTGPSVPYEYVLAAADRTAVRVVDIGPADSLRVDIRPADSLQGCQASGDVDGDPVIM